MARSAWDRERIEPLRYRLAHGTAREHLARYRFACDRLRGRVLDAGCGTGYGSLMLALSPAIREVLGIDHDRRAVDHADRFYRAPGVDFRRMDLLSSQALLLGLFDGIACFEVLEHLPRPERLLEMLDLCLADKGRLLISTPLGKGRQVPSGQPGHYFQLRRHEFEQMLKPRFSFRLYGQKGETIEEWQRGHRYFLMLALCRSRFANDGQGRAAGGGTAVSAG